ncbi:MAG TPA: alanine racemase [Methylotenera sp.]|nr:alanine racemase [Methylotenera sp.]
MSRPAIAHIRLDAFRHNYRIAKKSHGGKALAVIKANAYGHGAVQCAKAIENEADGFAVAAIEEALQLREAGITAPILLLEGFFEVAELPYIAANDLWIVIHHMWQLEILLAARLAKPLQVWLKMDTGMHRVGLSPTEYKSAYLRLVNHVNVAKIVLMSHFANADNLNSAHTQQQVDLFKQTVASLKLESTETSLANSAAILGWPQIQRTQGLPNIITQWTRPGIMLYGANPLYANQIFNQKHILRPVMQLTSRIISIRKIVKGETIGYGSIFTAECDTVVGVVACGYADGYPRSAVMGTPMAVDGKMTRLIGRVSMDMLFADLTDIPTAVIGSQVELWGDQVSANAVANSAGTIAYELFCNVKRVQFGYTDT